MENAKRLFYASLFFIFLISSCEKEDSTQPEPEVKYNHFENLDEMLANPYIADAIEVNEMEIYRGNNPVDLSGTYEVLEKENHVVKIDGVVGDFEEEDWVSGHPSKNWRKFLCEISTSEIQSSYLSGQLSRKVGYEIEGAGNEFTIYFQDELNPWFTKLDGKNPNWQNPNYMGGESYDEVGIEIPEGVHIVSGVLADDGSIRLSVLWVRIWNSEDAEGTGNWSYNEFYVEPEWSNYETFTDPRDGSVYRIVTIGNQTWFAENLKYEPKESDGYIGYELWPEGTDNKGDDKYYTWSNESETSKRLGGVAYTWTAATGYHVDESVPSGEVVQGVCPEGWHVPTAPEWDELIDYAGGEETANIKLNARVGWFEHLEESTYGEYIPPTNELRFNFSGALYVNGQYNSNIEHIVGKGYVSSGGTVWTIGNGGEINYAGTYFYSSSLPGGPDWDSKYGGLVIRCIKDEE